VSGQGFETRDATRRTRLANERTFLAWWRSGLTALAVGFGAGRIVPELSGGSSWPFVVIGIGFSLVGVALIVFGYERHRQVERALARGEYATLAERTALLFATCGAVLGLATALLLLLDPA
jgi:putative membrane protein